MTQKPLSIIDVGANGDGIARFDDGRTVFIPFAMTGDVVHAAIEQEGETLRGRIVSFERESDHRIVPPCRHFTICGGCALQHLDAPSYAGFKQSHVFSALEKYRVKPPSSVETVFIPAGTRRRANFAAIAYKDKTVIGFHERRSANIRNVPDCLIINDELRGIMEAFRPYIADIAGNGKKIDVLIQCADGQKDIALTGKIAPGWEAQQALSDALRTIGLCRISLRARDFEPYEILLEDKPFLKSFGPLTINLAPGAFLQPSQEGEQALTDCVLRGAAGATRIADLFCGNGTFTGPLMEERDIIAADSAPDAITALQKAGVKARARNLFKNPFTAEELQGRDCVIIDPPRSGAKAQIEELSHSSVPTIVYVSCNPQSFAQDCAALITGGYRLKNLTLVDQFIWSPHTEVVGVLTKI